MSKLFKSRHLPYRLFTKLLYSDGKALSSDFGIQRAIAIGDMAKSLRCSNARVIEALDWLQALGLISYQRSDKQLTIKIFLPIK